MQQTNNGSIIFIGDSITEAFNVNRYFRDGMIINNGVSGDGTADCLSRIEPAWFKTEPKFVFICIGTNDIARNKPDEEIIDGIKNIIIKIRKIYTKNTIVLNSIFPTRHNPPRPNHRIDALNKRIEKFSKKNNFLFLNISHEFKENTNQLKREFTTDGLHLTERAYLCWSELIKNFLIGQGCEI